MPACKCSYALLMAVQQLAVYFALLKRSACSSKVPDPSLTLTMSLRLPEASSDNGSSTESEGDSRGLP